MIPHPHPTGDSGPSPSRRLPGRGELLVLVPMLLAQVSAAQPLQGLVGRSADKVAAAAEAGAAKPSEPAPEAISVALIPGAAERAIATLREIESRLAPAPSLVAVEHDLSGLAATLADMNAAVSGLDMQQLSVRDLIDRQSEWLRHDARLRGWQDALERSSKTVLDDRATLRGMREVWEKTAAIAAAEKLPPAIVERIRSVQARVDSAEAPAQERLAWNLTLQDRIATERMKIAVAVSRLDQARLEAQESVFVRWSAPLWKTFERSRRPEAMLKEMRASGRENWRQLRNFAAANQRDLASLVVLFVALVLGALALRQRAVRTEPGKDMLPRVQHVLGRPYAAALLVFLTLAVNLNPRAPTVALELMALATMLPTAWILAGLVPEDLRRALLGLGGALLLELVRFQLPPYSWPARWLTLLESAGSLALLVWILRRGSGGREWLAGRWRRVFVGAVYFALALLAAATGANIVGKVAFAELATRGAVVSSYAAAVLYAVVQVLDAAFTALLAPALQGTSGQVAVALIRLRMRLSGIVRALATVSWAATTLLAFGIWGQVADHVVPFVTRRRGIGQTSFSLGDILLFAATLGISLIIARILRVLLHDGLSRVRLPRGVPAAISTTVQYLVVLFGFLLAVLAAGVDVSRFTILASALGVGVGFGLQNVVNNFVSGLILLYERPIQVGDTIEIGNGTLVGEVRRIGVRSSTVRTAEGAEVIVPNANLISSDVVNWTHSDRLRRLEIPVGVAYGTDPGRVIELLTDCARRHADVLATPEPVALFQGFGDSALDFALRFWTANFDQWMAVRSDVRVGVYEALRAAGIQIPFPQRDLHVRTAPDAAREALGPAATGAGAGRPRP